MSCDDDYSDEEPLTSDQKLENFVKFRDEFYAALNKAMVADSWYESVKWRWRDNQVSLLVCAHRIYQCAEGVTYYTHTKLQDSDRFNYAEVLTERECAVLYQYAYRYILQESTLGYNEGFLPKILEI